MASKGPKDTEYAIVLLLDTELETDTKVLTKSAKYQHLTTQLLNMARALVDHSKSDGVRRNAIGNLYILILSYPSYACQ